MISIYSIVRMDHLGWDPSAHYGSAPALVLPDILERYTEQTLPVNLENEPSL